MSFAIGIAVLFASSIAWLGQSLSFLAPSVALKFGALEPEDDVDPTLYIVEARAMGLSDMLLGWTLPAAALLMIVDHPIWPYLAMIGSGIFIYFSALIMVSRVYLKRAGKKVGRPAAERAAYVFGVIWIACSLIMIALAAAELSS
ncbi:MAG: hypothetical protein AMS21_12760 [Gemmatimonas sp. SG8_38_2]|nr:MAG: hypothetical protein AMS21_12760 [Gemmatimonas sp. SG8_38_2]